MVTGLASLKFVEQKFGVKSLVSSQSFAKAFLANRMFTGLALYG